MYSINKGCFMSKTRKILIENGQELFDLLYIQRDGEIKISLLYKEQKINV